MALSSKGSSKGSQMQVLASEADAWQRKSELCRSSGDKTGELDAMQRAWVDGFGH